MSLEAVRNTFEVLGKSDPLWAVLTLKQYKHNRWQPEAFFATGQEEIREVFDDLERLGLKIRQGRALDFGCAVGRLTQALGDRFDEVVGVDIAQSFLDLAQTYNRHGARCQFLHNTRDDLKLLESDSFDFIYSNITLQHIPPKHSAKYIAEFLRLLRPGGVAVFQIPSGPSPFDGTLSWCARRVRWTCWSPVKRWWKRVRNKPVIEMHPIPRDHIEEILRENGGKLIDVTRTSASGNGWISLRYYAMKEGGSVPEVVHDQSSTARRVL